LNYIPDTLLQPYIVLHPRHTATTPHRITYQIHCYNPILYYIPDTLLQHCTVLQPRHTATNIHCITSQTTCYNTTCCYTPDALLQPYIVLHTRQTATTLHVISYQAHCCNHALYYILHCYNFARCYIQDVTTFISHVQTAVLATDSSLKRIVQVTVKQQYICTCRTFSKAVYSIRCTLMCYYDLFSCLY
jgi:hypothetical protein